MYGHNTFNAGFITSSPIIRMQFQWRIRYNICRLNQLCMIQLAIDQMTSILGLINLVR